MKNLYRISSSIITFVALIHMSAISDVPVHGMFEAEFAHTASGNPFDVGLTATFTNGSKTVLVNGFYAGNNAYKIRFMPEELGNWSYSTSSAASALNSQTGSFAVIPSTIKGMIRVDNANANTMHHFVHANGDRFFYQGNTAKCLFGTPRTHAGVGGWKDFLDYCDAHNFNHIIVYLYAPTIATSSSAAEGMAPWPGSPPSKYAYNSGGKTDYWVIPWASQRDASKFAQYDNLSHSATSTADIDFSKFYTPYWDKVDTILDYMKTKDIIANIFFQPDDSYHPSTGANEDRYYKYGVDRLSAHWNVSFNLGLEYREYRSDAWANTIGAKVKQWDPYDHILTVHDHLTFRFKTQAWADYIVYQATPGTDGNSTYSSDYSANKPMSNDECGYEPRKATTNTLIDIIWQMIMRNCYNSYGNRQQMGMDFKNLGATDGAADAHAYMADFFMNTKWYEMGKGNGIYLINTAKSEAILYKSMSIPSGMASGLPIEFMDVRTGVKSSGGTTPNISKPGVIGTEYAVHIGNAGAPSGPVAIIDGGDKAIVVNNSVNFSGSNSSGIITEYKWNFGDGSADAIGVSVSHIYSSVGSFIATLTVTDNTGQTNSTTINVNVKQDSSQLCEYQYEEDVANSTEKILTIVADQLTYFAVTAYNGDGESGYSQEVSIESQTDQVKLTWDPASGATGYNVHWGVNSCGQTSVTSSFSAIKAVFPLSATPNPFNPVVSIAYHVSKDLKYGSSKRPVNVSIYNLAGKMVKTLVDGPSTAGDYQVMWNGSNQESTLVGSGIYIVRFTESDKIFSKKITLLK